MTPAYLRPHKNQRLYVGALALGAAITVTLVVMLIPRHVLTWDLDGRPVPVDYAKAVNDIRTSLLQGLAGLALLIGAVFTWRQHQLSRSGQAGERFAAAVGHLGDANIDVRVGGIHALEALTVTMPSERDTVVDVLSAFARRHAHVPDEERATWPSPAGDSLRFKAPDVHAALRVLARRTPRTGEVVNLDRLAAPGARLAYARFDQVDLHYSDLRSTDLHKASLRGADLTGSNLANARLTDATLLRADLRSILGHGLVAENADFRETDLTGADLTGARLSHARLDGADLRGATLRDADLAGARLHGAVCDETTVWPDRYDWRAAGVRRPADPPPKRPLNWTTPPAGSTPPTE